LEVAAWSYLSWANEFVNAQAADIRLGCYTTDAEGDCQNRYENNQSKTNSHLLAHALDL
jgi:hypothetical protein